MFSSLQKGKSLKNVVNDQIEVEYICTFEYDEITMRSIMLEKKFPFIPE